MVTYFLPTVQCESLVQGANIDASVSVVNYTDPPLEGAIANLSCPPELILTGPDSAKCLGNGEWEPDPREAKCNG